MRIVIADDEHREHRLIEILLNRIDAGVPVEIVGMAENGKEALNLIQEEKPDVLITDIRMPGLTGLELIRAVREAQQDLYIIVISGYEMFEYAHEAIQYGVEDYLVKPLHQNELENVMRKIAQKKQRFEMQSEAVNELRRGRQQLFLHKLAAGEQLMPGNEELTREKLNERYDCGFTRRYYYLAALKADVPSVVDNKEYKERFGKKASHAIAKTLIRYYGSMIYLHENDIIWFLIHSDEEVSGVLKKDLQNLIYELRRPDVFLGNVHATAVLSDAKTSLKELSVTAKQVGRMINDRIYLGTDKILPCLKYERPADPGDYIPGSFRRRMVTALQTEQMEEAEALIEELEERVSETDNSDGSLLYALADELIEILFYSIKEQIPSGELQSRQAISKRRCAQCCTPDNLSDTVRGIYREMLQYILKERQKQAAKPIEEAKRYIRKNYAKNISQTEVGEAVGLSPSYLSSLFKKEEGTSFSDYLTQTRIYAACDKLASTNDPIDRIAEEVGYHDTRYFNRIFKKVMKLSPGEYRKLY